MNKKQAFGGICVIMGAILWLLSTVYFFLFKAAEGNAEIRIQSVIVYVAFLCVAISSATMVYMVAKGKKSFYLYSSLVSLALSGLAILSYIVSLFLPSSELPQARVFGFIWWFFSSASMFFNGYFLFKEPTLPKAKEIQKYSLYSFFSALGSFVLIILLMLMKFVNSDLLTRTEEGKFIGVLAGPLFFFSSLLIACMFLSIVLLLASLLLKVKNKLS